ncbi:MAG: DNA polymerase III subunit epsilon [Burkholderiales bacterium]
MRQLVIDTETTGLDPRQGHRIIEFAALELVDRRASGRSLHLKFDPEREIDAAASEVHGMTWDDLKGQPTFRDKAAEIVEFVSGAEWVIHNAPFDVAFLDAEFARIDLPGCDRVAARVVDTLAMAREAWPGKRNNLDALCERHGVNNAHRTLHGALLDAQLLAEVYLAMTRGQEALAMDLPAATIARDRSLPRHEGDGRPALVVVAATPEEEEAHRVYLEELDRASKGRCVWLGLARGTPAEA